MADTPEDVAARWEVLKKAEKGRSSVTDGIPAALPALALAAKLQRKAESLGIDTGSLDDRRRQIVAGLDALGRPARHGGGRTGPVAGETLGCRPASGRPSDAAGRRGAWGRCSSPWPTRPAPGGRPRDGAARLRGPDSGSRIEAVRAPERLG